MYRIDFLILMEGKIYLHVLDEVEWTDARRADYTYYEAGKDRRTWTTTTT